MGSRITRGYIQVQVPDPSPESDWLVKRQRGICISISSPGNSSVGSQQLQSETLHQEEPGMDSPVLSPSPPHPVGPGWAGARALRELSPQIWRLPISLGSPASAPGRVGALCLPLDGRMGRHLGGHDSVPTAVQVRKPCCCAAGPRP